MKHFKDLNNLPEISFKSKERPALEELANYIDRMKQDLFDDRWSQATKKHIKTSLVLYIRSMQKQSYAIKFFNPVTNIVYFRIFQIWINW